MNHIIEKYQIIKDPILNEMIFKYIIIGSITFIGTNYKSIYNNIKLTLNQFNYTMKEIINKYILRKSINNKFYRNVDINYITENKQINELYKAVYWYLTNNEKINYLNEPYLQFVFEKKITNENKHIIKNNLSIHKIPKQQIYKNTIFKNQDIFYSLSTELITVYSDKDRKRENYKINLYTYISEFETNDILDEFCQHCLLEYINNLSSNVWSQLIYTNNNKSWSSNPSNNNRKIDTIILKDGLKEEIKTDLQLFLDSEEWYKDRDIPYTRGYLFYGSPGTGKTSMIKGISLYCKRHIHYLMLNEIESDSELLELLKKINYKETVLVIEDIDAMCDIVKTRENKNVEEYDECDSENSKDKEKKSKLTLSGLLNAIDGVFTCHGRILIMTTNHPELLDPALIRPGRIDCKYLFNNCNKDQIKGLYEMFFNKPIDLTKLDKIKDIEYSPAHITSLFLRYRNNPEESLNNIDIYTNIKV